MKPALAWMSRAARRAPTTSTSAAAVVLLVSACASWHAGRVTPAASALPPPILSPAAALAADLDAIFDDPILARALMAVDVETPDGREVYARNADKLVMPASNMKLVTVAVAADRLGWDYRYHTTLAHTGTISDGVLHGDLIVTGSGDPSIGSSDGKVAGLFLEWADELARAGVRRIEGRLIGDDRAFDDDGIGAGWAWDYLSAGYAAPTGALSYNENVVVLRVTPGAAAGIPALIDIGPPGHGLSIENGVLTGEPNASAGVDVARAPNSVRLVVKGRVPLGGATVIRTASIDNPTRFFVEGLRLALESRGIVTVGGAWDVSELESPAATGEAVVVLSHASEPFSTLAGYAMKASQNFYGETFLKTLGRRDGEPGTAAAGRQAVTATLARWGVPSDALVMYDGSGLSRYNYVTARALVAILRHAWMDERLRGPYVAALPVGGHDGTLETRMRNVDLDRRVQAKTGSISNVRALSGYLERNGGDKIVFAMIANNYTAANADIDAIVERALQRLTQAAPAPDR